MSCRPGAWIATALIFSSFAFSQQSGTAGFPGANFPSASSTPSSRVGRPLSDVAVTFTGRVYGSDHRPVANARVELIDNSRGTPVASTFTGPDGTFGFTNVSPDQYEVVATAGALEVRERVDVTLGPQAVELRLPTTATAANQNTVSVAALKVPEKARKALDKGQEYLAKHRLPEARRQILRALEIYPSYAEAQSALGLLDLEENHPQQAASELEKAVRLDPNLPVAYVMLGAAYNSLRQFDDALRAISTGMRLLPNYWQGYFERAKAHLGKKEYSAALREADSAQQTSQQDFAPLHLVRAYALLGLNNYQPAASELKLYLRLEPNSPDADEVRHTLQRLEAAISQQTSVPGE